MLACSPVGKLGRRDRRPRCGDVLSLPVLLLNRYFAPVSVTTARRGMVLMFGDAARALDEDGDAYDFDTWRLLPIRGEDDALPIVGGVLRVPRVMHLLEYDRQPRPIVRLTRRNLLLRDEYQCQYCAARPAQRDLNIDHVVPRSRNGEDSWENLVISCRRCNLKKGRRTPAEAGMRLLKQPCQPRWTTTAQILLGARHQYSEWQPFLKAG